jgi:hypothetical protein
MAPVLREAFCDGAADAAACSSDDGDALVYDCTLRAEPVGGGILQERRGEHRGHRWTEQVAGAQMKNKPPDGGLFVRSSTKASELRSRSQALK